MTNNKQITAVEWLWEIAYNRELTVEDWKQAKAMHKEETIEFAINYTYGTKRVGASLKEDFITLYEQTYGGGEQ
jgi:hypothetical protein